ncbi:unnamed protein product, partial [marine sediment metagenome]
MGGDELELVAGSEVEAGFYLDVAVLLVGPDVPGVVSALDGRHPELEGDGLE